MLEFCLLYPCVSHSSHCTWHPEFFFKPLLMFEIFGVIFGQTGNQTENSQSKPGMRPSSNREWSKSSLAGFSPFPVWVRSDSRFRPEILGPIRVWDRVQTENGQNLLWQVLHHFRFESGLIPGLDQKFPVQTGFWTEFDPDQLEIVSGEFSVGSSFSPVWIPVYSGNSRSDFRSDRKLNRKCRAFK
jgi:hypothetical protein